MRDLVWGRAGGACEYCRMPQAFYRARYQIDHVIARQHSGGSDADNLALICPHCNLMMFSGRIGNLTPRPVYTCPRCSASFLPQGVIEMVFLNRRP